MNTATTKELGPGSSAQAEEADEETDLDVSGGKLVIDLDFQSGEECGSGDCNSFTFLHSSENSTANFPKKMHAGADTGAGSLIPNSIPSLDASKTFRPNFNVCSQRNSNIDVSHNKNNKTSSSPSGKRLSNSDKLKLKIKRRKMQTRTSAASHMVVTHSNHGALIPPCPITAPAPENGEMQIDDDLSSVPSSIALEKLEQKDASTWVRTVSTSVDGDSLGPCQPGTHVSLEGIVWNETPGGVLVVNVTWKGKTYVGSLLDSTKYNWAPPRLCDSPNVDTENNKGVGGKGRNGKRPPARIPHSASTSDLNLARKTGKMKSKLPAGLTPVDLTDEDSNSSGGPSAPVKTPAVVGETILEPMSPLLAECPCRACDKHFADELALKFHQNDSHRNIGDGTEEGGLCGDKSASSETSDGDAKLSDVEAESLKQLFQVVGSPESSSSKSASAMSLSQSGAKVKAIAAVAPRTATTDLPKLEISEDRAGSRSPAYSDISDDGAPVLEKEVDKSAVLKLDPSDPDPEPLPKKLAMDSSADISCLPKKETVMQTDSRCIAEVSCSASTSESGGVPVSHSTGSMVSNTMILPSAIAHPAYGQIPRMFPFDPATQQLMAAGFLNPNPGFGFGINTIPSNLVVPTSLSKSSSGSHKMSELAKTELTGSPKTSDSAQIRVPCRNKGSSSSSGRPSSSSMEAVKTSASLQSATASPPVQRHMHTHHHTHNFPFFQTTPFGLINPQQTPSMNGLPAGYHEK